MPDSSLTTAEKIDFGACRAVKLTCVSEIGWFSNDGLMQDIAGGGGTAASQWHIPWREENARGSCSMLEVEGLDGSHRRLLIDSGWNRDYIRDRFAATGVDRLLRTGEIEGVFLTHEHMDHLFGLQAVLELKPDVSIYIPSTFTDEAYRFIAGNEFPDAHASNAAPHQGALIRLESGSVHVLMPGLATVGKDRKHWVFCFGVSVAGSNSVTWPTMLSLAHSLPATRTAKSANGAQADHQSGSICSCRSVQTTIAQVEDVVEPIEDLLVVSYRNDCRLLLDCDLTQQVHD
ncbi:MAG: MBL fold metallo-hydrolase [Rhodopseudomonas palustris]|nr:MAG: MBL fold metallo-hydrolase [Rhodopseudomonas palustris]